MKKKLKVVIDTNIFISSLLGGKSCKFICESFEKQKFILILSNFILKEIKDVLLTKDIGDISLIDVERLFKAIETNAEFVKPSKKISLCRDGEDDKILEAALEAKADFIVTGDDDLLSIKGFSPLIITPKEFIKYLES